MAKRYYWLKLYDDFFRQKPIKKLRKIAGGDTFTIIYLKMLLIAMKQGNKLYYEGVEEDFCTELALDLDEDLDNVRLTVSFLLRQGLMEQREESEFFMTECDKMVGSESSSAERMRRLRDKKASQSDKCVTLPLRDGDVEKEIEIEKEIDTRDIELSSDNSTCSEPSKKARKQKVEEPLADVEAIILNNGSEWRPTVSQLDEYKRLYPGVDVIQEFRNMRGWCNANPAKRKTPAGIRRFVANWLSREQDRGGRPSRNRDTRYMTTDEYMQATAGWYQDEQ